MEVVTVGESTQKAFDDMLTATGDGILILKDPRRELRVDP